MHCILPGRVVEAFKEGKDGQVIIIGQENKGVRKIDGTRTAQFTPMNEESLDLVSNVIALKDLSENSLLHNLRVHFQNDLIYTAIGGILVSVNPFKQLPLYDPDTLEEYSLGKKNLPPHVYKVAHNAYRDMIENHRAQSCLVSGESGAGKTEATKVFLQFMTEMSARVVDPEADMSNQGLLQEQILKASPLLEAFGNARTVRNKNSSRFGKYIDVKFNNRLGSILSGSITQYLLEKTRIVNQSKGERNYHIFYQLLDVAARDDDLKKKYRCMASDRYNYLKDPSASEDINDVRGWEETVAAMQILDMTAEERDDLLRTVSAILHLGNISFQEKDLGGGAEPASQISDKEAIGMLQIAAYQLGVPAEDLENALIKKNLSYTEGEAIYKNYSIQDAESARDAFAKSVYDKMFDWLIKRVNFSLAGGKTPSLEERQGETTIGVLDIFGFEFFEVNSFEQVCVLMVWVFDVYMWLL